MASNDQIRLIVRADDMGMTHGCNAAVRACFEAGVLTCAAIQAPIRVLRVRPYLSATIPSPM